IVMDQFTNPVAGAAVTFAPSGGSVQFPTATTNASGVASAGTWTLPTTPGAKSLVATVGNAVSITFSATASVGAASALSIVAGNNQTAAVNTAVATAPSVRLADAFGNGISGSAVTFAVASGGGTIVGG